MAAIDDDAVAQANIILATTELKPTLMDWLVEDIHKECQVLETLPRCGSKPKDYQTRNNI